MPLLGIVVLSFRLSFYHPFFFETSSSNHADPEIFHKIVTKQALPASVAESADRWEMCPPVCSAIGFGSVW